MSFVRQMFRGHGTPGAGLPTINTADTDPTLQAVGSASMAYAAAKMAKFGDDTPPQMTGNVWMPQTEDSIVAAKQAAVAAFYEGVGTPGALTIQVYALVPELERWAKVGAAVTCAFGALTALPFLLVGATYAFQPVVAATVSDGIYRFAFALDLAAG